MEREYQREQKYLLAKKRVDKMKGFYYHFLWYVLVNIFISGVIIYGLMHEENDSFSEAMSNFGVYSTWIFWGIGVFFHWMGVFGQNKVFSKKWEEKKLKEFMNDENFQYMRNNNTQEQKYIRAKKRVEDLKSYYWHLAIYLIINIFIITRKTMRNLNNGETFEQAFFDIGTFAVAILWGVPMLLHTFKIFGFTFFVGKDWEERKIKEFMNENSHNYGKR